MKQIKFAYIVFQEPFYPVYIPKISYVTDIKNLLKARRLLTITGYKFNRIGLDGELLSEFEGLKPPQGTPVVEVWYKEADG